MVCRELSGDWSLWSLILSPQQRLLHLLNLAVPAKVLGMLTGWSAACRGLATSAMHSDDAPRYGMGRSNGLVHDASQASRGHH